MLTVAAVAMAAAAGLLGTRALAHRAILHGLRAPRVHHTLCAADLRVPAGLVRDFVMPGPGGKSLMAWLVMPTGKALSAATLPVPAVLLMHGWGGNAAMMAPVVQPLHAAGFAVLLIDARCHGHSDGEPFTSMPRFAQDIGAGLAWLRRQPGIAADRVALLGHSVGAAACLLHAAQHRDVRAVVSISSFAHPQEVMRRFMADRHVPYPVFGWYVLRHVQKVIGTRFEAIAPLHTIAQVRCPVLLVHGLHDTTVPFDDAVRLQTASPQTQLLPLSGDHDLRECLPSHTTQLQAFLSQAFEGHVPTATHAAGGHDRTPAPPGVAHTSLVRTPQ